MVPPVTFTASGDWSASEAARCSAHFTIWLVMRSGQSCHSLTASFTNHARCTGTGKLPHGCQLQAFPIHLPHKITRHRASTGMYSLTFCIRVMSPERHHRNPAVQDATVMLTTPPVDGQSPASQPRQLAIYDAQCWEHLRHPPVTNQQHAHTPRKLGFTLCCHSNATGAPIANPPNSAQLGGSL